MSIKVVVNHCYGGFGLSEKAVALIEERTGEEFDAYTHPRHCSVLVSVVEELGDAANGASASLTVEALRWGSRYIIEEYDGSENVCEPEQIKWIDALARDVSRYAYARGED